MKYSFVIIFFVFLCFACGTTKEVVVKEVPPDAQPATEIPEEVVVETTDTETDTVIVRQQRGFRSEEFKKELDAMIARLDLSEEQEVVFAEIQEKYGDQTRAVMENSDGDFRSVRAEISAIKEAQQQELKEILTAAQYEEYQAFVEAQRAKRFERRERRRGGGQ